MALGECQGARHTCSTDLSFSFPMGTLQLPVKDHNTTLCPLATRSYRAKFIVGSVALLLAKPEGGETWLLGLRQQPFEEAVEHLSTLPGVCSFTAIGN